jgi:hypothetical protein
VTRVASTENTAPIVSIARATSPEQVKAPSVKKISREPVNAQSVMLTVARALYRAWRPNASWATPTAWVRSSSVAVMCTTS